jgi:hypothetical protein
LADLEEQLAAAFVMYPNPAKKELFLHVDATTILDFTILDMQGRIIRTEKVNGLSVVKLNTESIQAGSYVVKVTTPYGAVQQTLIIE